VTNSFFANFSVPGERRAFVIVKRRLFDDISCRKKKASELSMRYVIGPRTISLNISGSSSTIGCSITRPDILNGSLL